MSNFDSERVLAGRVRLHVRDWPGANPPVVFIHDLTANGLSALRLSTLLVHRRRVIAPDLRGRGKSDSPFGEYGVNLHTQDVIACLNTMGVETFVAAGHGYGASVALTLAAQFPDRAVGLMLLDGGAIPDETVPTLDRFYTGLRYRFPSTESFVAEFRDQPLYQPWTGELETFIRSNMVNQPDGSAIRHVSRYAVETDWHDQQVETMEQLPTLYAAVQCPVLILRAGRGITQETDQVLPNSAIQAMTSGMPQAKVVTIPEAAHLTLLTIPSAERNAAILDFLGIPDKFSI